LSLISAIAAVSICPTSHQDKIKAGKQRAIKSLNMFTNKNQL